MVTPVNVVDAGLVARSLTALGCTGRYRLLRKLAGGASGAQVFLLELDDMLKPAGEHVLDAGQWPDGRMCLNGAHVVLKVTEDPVWRPRALRELAVYAELAANLDVAFAPVLAAGSDSESIRLLLTEQQPYPAAPLVSRDAWVGLADELGRLHQPPPRDLPWLTYRPWPTPERVEAAVQQWNALGFGTLARRAAEQVARGRELEESQRQVLTHGDCHVGNLLRSTSGDTMWADWQEVCLSSGFGDLAFLWQRAEFADARPPREAMTEAYLERRDLGRAVDARAALEVCELLLLLVAWPPYIPLGLPSQQRALTRRLEQLVDQRPSS